MAAPALGADTVRKKIDVQYLEMGMYIAELDRPWLGTPFLFQGFEVRSEAELLELKRLCKWVYVDTPDIVAGAPMRRPAPAPSAQRQPTRQSEAEQRVAREFLKIINQPRAQPVYTDRCEIEQEIPTAREHASVARTLIYQILEDVRTGKNIDAISAKRVVGALAESVIRNPDALTCFIQLKNKDEYTAQHSMRVCILALAFGRHLGLDRETLELLGTGALLHDIGKMKVPSEILNKPAALTDYEFSLMKSHVPRGVELLERMPGIPRPAIEVARCHHERYAGSGYIGGLTGDQIGFFGMVGGIVDCYDAVTSDRAYRAGMSAHAALKQMYEWRGRDFHPGLVEQFIQCMGIYPIGSVVELNTGEVAVVVTMNRVRRLKPRVTLVLNADYSPYNTPVTVDLMKHKTSDGRACEIDRVLEPGIYGIDPVRYLPVIDPKRFLRPSTQAITR
jgi:putative nucleotidyltransferase with HDIG domain